MVNPKTLHNYRAVNGKLPLLLRIGHVILGHAFVKSKKKKIIKLKIETIVSVNGKLLLTHRIMFLLFFLFNMDLAVSIKEE